jgi:hypothetical protein
MTINVYWACIDENWMLAREPEPVRDSLLKLNIITNDPDTHINKCPAFQDHIKNLYGLKSIYNYDLSFSDNQIRSNSYDQNFFDKMISIRSIDNKFLSYKMKYIFFTDGDSLRTTFYEFPFLEDNDFSKKCIPLTAEFDIGKWFRNTEYPFILKKEFNSLNIKEGDVYSYMRFHTDKKINFKQFRFSNLLHEYRLDGFNLTNVKSFKKLKNYYSCFKNKELILKEIKNNLLEKT